MAYMLLVVEPRGQRAERTEAEGREAYASMLRYAESLDARGKLLACESLQSDASAQRLQVRSGKRTIRDGPFTEAREMIGGFFLIDCATREEALAIAEQCPAAEWATLEIRETGPCFLESRRASVA